MPLYDRSYMSTGDSRPGWRPNGAYLGALALILAANLFVFAAWVLGAHDLLNTHFLVSAENLAAGRLWTLLTAGVFHVDMVHAFCSLLAFTIGAWALRDVLTAKGLLGVYGVASVVCSLALLVWPVQSPYLVPGHSAGSGTAFYVDETLLLTNAHVVGEAETVRLTSGAGSTAQVVARDRDLDLALLRTQEPGRVIPLCRDALRAGVTVFAHGFGSYSEQNDTLLVTKGTIASPRDHSGMLVFDGTLRPGNSGGPLLDGDGRWLAVATAIERVPGQTGVGLAVNGEDAYAWIESRGFTIALADGMPLGELPPQEVQEGIVRVLTIEATGGWSQGVLREFWLDPRVFGASGAAWALLAMAILGWFRAGFDEESGAGAFAGLVFLFLLLDPTGKLRAYTTPNSAVLEQGFHLAGCAVGFVAWRMLHAPPSREDRASSALPPPVSDRAPERVSASEPGPASEAKEPSALGSSSPPSDSPLNPAERERMDGLLRQVGATGLDSLSGEDRAFLDEASRRLKHGRS